MNTPDIRAEFELSEDTLRKIAGNFADCMAAGLRGDHSPLKMLPSFLEIPSGKEAGRFLALDFGGTNVRCLDIELAGKGGWRIYRAIAKPLRDAAANYDLTGNSTGAEELFNFIADLIHMTAAPGRKYFLGHTFSYPCRQRSAGDAILLAWTKELQVKGVVGQPVNQLLAAALKRRDIYNIVPIALLNDTVGTLLTGGFLDHACDIGSICGTGHNTCYWEIGGPQAGIINMEAGNFNILPQNFIDRSIDGQSDQPGAQLLEKMVGGRYLGEIALAILRLGIENIPADAALDTAALARVLVDNSPAQSVASQLLVERCVDANPSNINCLRSAAGMVIRRAAQLAAATYFGVMLHVDPQLRGRHQIAIDGSLYEKIPDFASHIDRTLTRLLEGSGAGTVVQLVREGSAIGAALAAAQCRTDLAD